MSANANAWQERDARGEQSTHGEMSGPFSRARGFVGEDAGLGKAFPRTKVPKCTSGVIHP